MWQLRCAFMRDFTAGLKNKDVLFEWALVTIVGSAAGGMYRHGRLEKRLLQEIIGQESSRTYDIQPELLRAFYEKDPGHAMALMVYGNTGDDKNAGYYYRSLGESMPYYQKNKDLDEVYEYLCRLGYQMSDEEKQLQDGTHLLFKKEEEM